MRAVRCLARSFARRSCTAFFDGRSIARRVSTVQNMVQEMGELTFVRIGDRLVVGGLEFLPQTEKKELVVVFGRPVHLGHPDLALDLADEAGLVVLAALPWSGTGA